MEQQKTQNYQNNHEEEKKKKKRKLEVSHSLDFRPCYRAIVTKIV